MHCFSNFNFQSINSLAAKLRYPDWHLNVAESLRPAEPIKFDYVLPISARLGEIDQMKKVLRRLYKDLHPNFSGSIDHDSKMQNML